MHPVDAPCPDAEWAGREGVPWVDPITLASTSTVASIHVPFTLERHHTNHRESNDCMKPGVIRVHVR
jgi:D-lactate dehydrogenase